MKYPRGIFVVICTLIFAALSANAQQVIFTEIMYNPSGATGAEKAEYIKIKNTSGTPRDMAKWRFDTGVTYVFPDFNSGASTAHILGPFETIYVSSKSEATTRTE